MPEWQNPCYPYLINHLLIYTRSFLFSFNINKIESRNKQNQSPPCSSHEARQIKHHIHAQLFSMRQDKLNTISIPATLRQDKLNTKSMPIFSHEARQVKYHFLAHLFFHEQIHVKYQILAHLFHMSQDKFCTKSMSTFSHETS